MTLRRSPVRTRYSVGGIELAHVSEIRDLGVMIDTKLTFAPHVTDIVSRANRALGLLMRSFQVGTRAAKFNRSAIMAAYCANVRSIMEYGCVVWAGAASSHVARVDRVQHKFLTWLLSRTSSGHADSLSYSGLLSHFKIPSLAARRVQHDLLFLRNVVRGKVDCMALLRAFSLHVPPRSTRASPLFSVPPARVRTVDCGVFCRATRAMNSFSRGTESDVDLFSDSAGVFRAQVLKYVLTI